MNIFKKKKTYTAPEIISIELDKEISLAMESEPEGEPSDWGAQAQPMKFNNDPFNTNLG